MAALVGLSIPWSAYGQVERRIRLGLLYASTREGVASEQAAFVARLEELGWVPGKNVEIIARYANGQPARIPALARELVEREVDAVFVPNTQGAVELQKLSGKVAIVFVALDPVQSGLVGSLARPGRNATGFTQGGITIAAKRVELLKDAFPSIRKLGVLADRNFPVQTELSLVSDTARSLGLSVHVAEASSGEQYRNAVLRLQALGVDAFYVVYTGSAFAVRRELANDIRDTRLPAIYGQSRFADDGGLIAYSWETLKVSRLAAEYADRILRGSRPADLPVQQPVTVELVVNLATARAQGLKLPRSFLVGAVRLVE